MMHGIGYFHSSQFSWTLAETDCDLKKGQNKDASEPLGISSLSATQKKSVCQVISATSGSSREQSDDDEAEGEAETTQNMDPTDVKRVRR